MELVDVGVPNLWGLVEVLRFEACDEVCVKKRGRRGKGDTWWLYKEVKEAVSRKKDVHKTMLRNINEENMRRYKSMKNKAWKAIS